MTWVQQNYDRFLLALFAVILLACSALLFNNAHNFTSVFDSIKGQVAQKSNVPRVEQEAVMEKQQKLAKPDEWPARIVNNRRLPVFVSPPYIADGDHLVDPMATGDRPLHPPVPNAWLIDNGQDLLSPNVLDQDSDGDGFTALDEYNGKTNPQDKNSHPPYWSKMVLSKVVNIPFRLRFDAKNGETIQINVIDVPDAPTVFVKVGKMIEGTTYKVIKFEQKTAKDPQTGIPKDVSEVTVQNTVNGETIVLPKQQEVDSPTSYAVINYLWTGKPFAVKKNQEFTIEPEKNVKYKCLDLNEKEVTILKEDENKKLSIKPAAAKS